MSVSLSFLIMLAWSQPKLDQTIDDLKHNMASQHGEATADRFEQGMKQVAALWRQEDGDREAFSQFVTTHFVADEDERTVMFERTQQLLEQLSGHLHEIRREFRNQADLERGPIMAFDRLFAAYDPGAHVLEDLFNNKLAFVILLNFPLSRLEEKTAQGPSWSRRQWAEARLADLFSKRIPGDVQMALSAARSEANRYIAGYNIWMHHLIDHQGQRLFPTGLRLLSHWNLRDEIKANYGQANALQKQRMIQSVLTHIVEQTIPEVVIDNPFVDWDPIQNQVWASKVNDAPDRKPSHTEVTNQREPDRRYETLLRCFKAARQVDAYSPGAPTHIARRFNENRELPEARVKAIFESVMTSPHVALVAQLIEKRLGRPLEPFDIWYNGFKAQGPYTQQELDALVAKRYPDAAAFEADMPRMLMELGFSNERAAVLAANIVVDPARGSGHAMGAQMRSAKAHLRTRVGKNGMDYKGYNIAVHELGHNVEQTFSLNFVDHTLLEGVPNTAFTEALAFVFQDRDLALLGLTQPDQDHKALATLESFWNTYEIAGVALVDMAVWHWMYDHPDCSPAQLREATIEIAKDVWNRYAAPVFGVRDVVLFGVYSHMIQSFLYLPDYPLGHLIAYQIESTMKGPIGEEFERVSRLGRLTPDLWMQKATGQQVSADALLLATDHALQKLNH